VSGTAVDWGNLQSEIAGEVVLPESAGWSRLPPTFNARFHEIRPQAVVRCSVPEDAAKTISFVRRFGLKCAVRSGGHCFAGRSSTHGVVVDVSPMDVVSLSDGVATVGTGARLGGFYDSLQERGLTIPGGTCPSVGIAGLALGGGLGILGRSQGVTSDHLIGAEIVLADGRILRCDEGHHEDLFWALRGAGAGNFGVVTSLVFRTVSAPEVTNFHAAWPYAKATAVVDAWQTWAPAGPDELAASLKVTASEDQHPSPTVDVYGAFLGTPSDAAQLVDQLVVRANSEPSSLSAARMTFPETRRFWAQLGSPEDGERNTHPEHPYLFSKSEFFGRPLPREAIERLIEVFSKGRLAGESRELDFMPWGGAYNRVRPEATAFVHRAERFQLKHSAAFASGASAQSRESAHGWVARSWATVHPWGSRRVFQNFADSDLEDWTHAYYGTNYARLVRVKGTYDPTNVFRFHQSLPTR
jgi:FAD/FMN-containing dehydrogenase